MGFENLVKLYILNLNLPQEQKDAILRSNPKSLADVSLWLEKNSKKNTISSSNNANNPFSQTQLRAEIAKEINLFSSNNINSMNLNNKFLNNSELVDTDDASWGLGIAKAQDSSAINYYSSKSQQNVTSKKNEISKSQSQTEIQKEAQDDAIESIKENINTAIEHIINQTESEGNVSKAYNSLKEYFDAEMALSSVCRTIFVEQTTVNLLEKAQAGNLTREEYYKEKINTVIDMLTRGKELTPEEKACLEARFSDCTPDELNQLIDRIKTADESQYASITGNLNNLIEEGRRIIQTQQGDSSGVSLETKPNSIRALIKNGSAKELMTFEQVYQMERGVEFNAEAIKEYDEAAARFSVALVISNKAEALHELLDETLNVVQNNNKHGCDEQTRVVSEKNLENGLIQALKQLYGDDEQKINEQLLKLSGGNVSYQNGEIVYNEYSSTKKGDILASMAQQLLDTTDKNLEKTLQGRSLSYYEKKMQSAYEFAYGRKNATQLAKAYQNDQENIVSKVRSGVEYTGAGIMVAGMFIYPPAAFAGAIAASFGGVAVEAYNEGTRKEGLSEDAKQKIMEELRTNATLFAIGGAAGKLGSAAKAALIAEKCPALVACIADIGLDSTLSLLGDMALTGEVDLAGEGFSQIMSILAGKVRAGKFGNKPISRQDMDITKNPVGNNALDHLRRTDPQLYEDYKLLRSKNMLPANLSTLWYNPKNTQLSENLKKDIALMADCVRKGIDPKDAFVPKLKSLEEASRTKKTGEVFSLEGTNDLYIMDENGPVKLDMDRDMYYALFPPIQSHCTNQGDMGDCYFVCSVLDGAMNNPKAKVELLKMFHQKGDDIIFENTAYGQNGAAYIYDELPSKVVFKDAKKRATFRGTASINGAMGLKIVEQAYGYKLAAKNIADFLEENDYPQEFKDRIYSEIKKIFEDSSYKPSKEFNDLLKKYFKESKNTTILVNKDLFEVLRQKSIGSGGWMNETLMDFFGLSGANCSKIFACGDAKELFDTLKQINKNPNAIITSSTLNPKFKVEPYLQEFATLFGVTDRGKLAVVSLHAYRIAGYDPDKKTISIVNPWDTTKVVELTYEQYQKFFGNDIHVVDVSQKAESPLPEVAKKMAEKIGISICTENGRFLTEGELVKSYIKKLQKEKNIQPPKTSSVSGEGYKNVEFIENPRIQSLLANLKSKGVNDFVRIYMLNAVYDNCKFDQEKIDKMCEYIEKIFAEDVDLDLSSKISLIAINHSDYEFMLEKSTELIPVLKAKGYSDDMIVDILQSLTKENYEEMKVFWQ